MFLSTTFCPFLPNNSVTTSVKDSKGKPRRAIEAPMATMFFIKDVPSCSAISVNGTAYIRTSMPSGAFGLNLLSATITPP